MKLQEITYQNLRWINITEPNQAMVDYLRENFHFHPLNLEDVLSKVGFPKVDAYQDYLYIVFQFPVYESDRRIYKRDEVDVFLSKDYIITVNSGRLTPLQNFFETCRLDELAKEKFMSKGVAMLVYEIIDALLNYIFPIINQKNEFIFGLEEEIFETPELKDMVQEIMILKRNIINMRRILAPQRSVLVELQTKHKQFVPEETKIYFDDLLDKKDKIISQLDTAMAYVNVLNEANESIITRNTNRVITVLTVFTVIMLPLSLVTGYFGMNVNLPFQASSHALTYVNAILLGLFALMIIIFAKKRWL